VTFAGSLATGAVVVAAARLGDDDDDPPAHSLPAFPQGVGAAEGEWDGSTVGSFGFCGGTAIVVIVG